MYMDSEKTFSFLEKLFSNQNLSEKIDVAIFVQSPLLPVVQMAAHRLTDRSMKSIFGFGPQNVHWENQGAFTGELSCLLAKEFGSEYALVGHSERRALFGESVETAGKRALHSLKNGIRVVFCVGENLSEREAGKTFSVVKEHLAPILATSDDLSLLEIAYEPVWAIGTGKTATPDQAQEVHAFIREELNKAKGADFASKCRVLYGGSVKPENAAELMSKKDVDGVLVGGASLEVDSFVKICEGGMKAAR